MTLVVGLILTIFFAFGCAQVEIKTIFSDLLPKNHPYVKTYKEHSNFGNPLTVTIMVKRIDGETIFNQKTLEKIWNISRDIDLAPGVDHDQIVSIATEKARYTVITADGIFSYPIMDDHPPKNISEINEIKRRINESPTVSSFLVSNDHKSAIINATFIESLVDYKVLYDAVQALKVKFSDGQHEIHISGWPMLTGWVYFFGKNTPMIFIATVSLMFIFLIVSIRNIAGVVAPLIVCIASAIWGFGFVGWIRQPIEPLLMIVPLLLIARSFSHCVQATERYYEVLLKLKDKRKAAKTSLELMFAPGILGIFTDACGLALVGIAPIPAMERFAIFTAFWAMMLIPTSLILTPVILSLLPVPKNLEELVSQTDNNNQKLSLVQKILQRTLLGIASLVSTARYKFTAVFFIIATIISLYLMLQVKVGNPVEGSNLLHDNAEFNIAVKEINKNFPGSMTLEVIFEGKDGRIVRQSDTLESMTALQMCLEAKDQPPAATLSFADYSPEANRLFNGGNPKWSPIDKNDIAAAAASGALMLGTSPTAYLHIADFEQKNATVSLWYKNNKQETVDRAISDANSCISQIGVEHDKFKIRMASGSLALQQSINETIDIYQWYILAGLNLAILLGCAYAYASYKAALILLIPVNLANLMLTAFMVILGLGLDINTLPILAIGIGVGIDYGIYLISRIREEYQNYHSFEKAISYSLITCGKAILFTAFLMIIGIAPWYFLSEFKFLADMGMLLVVVMGLNTVLSLILVPLLIYIFKPRFITTENKFLSESLR